MSIMDEGEESAKNTTARLSGTAVVMAAIIAVELFIALCVIWYGLPGIGGGVQDILTLS